MAVRQVVAAEDGQRQTRGGVRDLLDRHAVVVFFVVTYALSWAVWVGVTRLQAAHPLSKLGAFAPTVAALLLTAVMQGGSGVRDLLARVLIWRVKIGWYLFALFSTAGIVVLALGVYALVGGSFAGFSPPKPLVVVVPGFLYVLFTSVVGEELGWRGFALPRLLDRYGALAASLILGLVWGLWHLPLFRMAGDFHEMIPLSAFLLQEVALTVLYTWMYQNTRGSLLLPHLFHTAGNFTLYMLPVLPFDTGGDVRPLWFAVAGLCLMTVAVVVRYGPREFRDPAEVS